MSGAVTASLVVMDAEWCWRCCRHVSPCRLCRQGDGPPNADLLLGKVLGSRLGVVVHWRYGWEEAEEYARAVTMSLVQTL